MLSIQQLTEIFANQSSLARKFHPIELANGYSPPDWPVNIQSREGQDRIRQFAWWICEEMGEALMAPQESFAEEMADILHFSVELCLIIGITPAQVVGHGSIECWDTDPVFAEVFAELVRGINLLKAKPWKQQPKPTPPEQFHQHISGHLYLLLRVFDYHEIDAYEQYFHKKKINEQRIQSGV